MNTYINCSPKLKNSNSEYFINLIKNNKDTINYIYKDNIKNIKENIKNSNNIIFVYPLYIDTIPSKLIEIIENLDSNLLNKKNCYIICNCGFLEPSHNNLSIKAMENWIAKNNGIFMGYLSIGSGEIIGITKRNKLLKFFCKDFFKKINKFKKNLDNNNKVYLTTNIKWLNKNLFCIICNKFFKKRIQN